MADIAYTIRVEGQIDRHNVRRAQAIRLLNIDEHDFDWAIEEEGLCSGADKDGRSVQIVATGDEDRLS